MNAKKNQTKAEKINTIASAVVDTLKAGHTVDLNSLSEEHHLKADEMTKLVAVVKKALPKVETNDDRDQLSLPGAKVETEETKSDVMLRQANEAGLEVEHITAHTDGTTTTTAGSSGTPGADAQNGPQSTPGAAGQGDPQGPSSAQRRAAIAHHEAGHAAHAPHRAQDVALNPDVAGVAGGDPDLAPPTPRSADTTALPPPNMLTGWTPPASPTPAVASAPAVTTVVAPTPTADGKEPKRSPKEIIAQWHKDIAENGPVFVHARKLMKHAGELPKLLVKPIEGEGYTFTAKVGDKENVDVIAAARAKVAEAQKNLRDASALLDLVPLGWRPGGAAAGPKSDKLEVGDTVAVREQKRAEYKGMIEPGDFTGLVVKAVVGAKVKLLSLSDETLVLPAAHVYKVNE